MAHEHPDVTGNIDVISDSEVRQQVFLCFLNCETKISFTPASLVYWPNVIFSDKDGVQFCRS